MVVFVAGTQWVYFHGLQKNPVLTSSLILEIASHYEFVPSQVVLRWAIHENVTVIPRSKNPRNIYLNFRALDFALTDEEIFYFNNITDFEYHPLEVKVSKGMGKSSLTLITVLSSYPHQDGGRGQGGGETGRKGDGRCMGGGRRGGGKREKREKLRNIAQYFAIEKKQIGGSQQIQGGNRD